MTAVADRSLRSWRTPVVLGATGVGVALLIALAHWLGLFFFSAFTGIGSYLAVRRPANSVGLFLMLIGWGLALGSMPVSASIDALLAGRLDGIDAFVAWANGWGWAAVFVGCFGISVVFPSGVLPTGGAGRAAGIALGALIGIAAALAFGPVISVTPATTGIALNAPNPAALLPGAAFWDLVPLPDVLFPAMFVIVLGGVVGLVRRYRRSVDLERLQYRWLVGSLAFVAIATVIWAIATLALGSTGNGGPGWLLLVVAYPTVPLAIVVAILRYRLYDIDRIISRSIAYASVSAVLLAIFGGAVLLLSAALSSVAGGQSIAVAASTVIAYAAFQPVLGRVRRVVDRRFDRARYDGERTAIIFAARVRDETDVEAVVRDLTSTAQVVVAPTSLALWLRPHDVRR
jgi:hypothetical protein